MWVPSKLSTAKLKYPGMTPFREIRLIDFPTGKADLAKEHEGWLEESARAIPADRNPHINIVGYASKLGYGGGQQHSDALNKGLSFKRANQVARRLESVNPRVTGHMHQFEAKGNKEYYAAASDNSAEWRAVEVHIFLDEVPPPHPDIDPPPPCHGGQRFRKWSIATPGGLSFTFPPSSPVGVVTAGNLVAFKKEEGAQVMHTFFSPGVGGGGSYSGPKLGKIAEFIKTILGKPTYSGMSWSPFTAETAFNFGDLNGATCAIVSAGAGAGPGYQRAKVSVYGSVWFRDSKGECMLKNMDFFKNVDTSGKDLQLGVGASAVGGPLVQVD